LVVPDAEKSPVLAALGDDDFIAACVAHYSTIPAALALVEFVALGGGVLGQIHFALKAG